MKNVIKIFICAFLIVLNFASISAKNWYISTTGSDAVGDGSIGNPLASVWPFFNANWASPFKYSPGDTIFYRGGTYYGNGWNNGQWVNTPGIDYGILRIHNADGTPNQHIVFMPYHGEHAILRCDNSPGSHISGSEYVDIIGFEIYGGGERIDKDSAQKIQWFYWPDSIPVKDETTALYRIPKTVVDTGGCIDNHWNQTGYPTKKASYNGAQGIIVGNSHHIKIVNNHIHHCHAEGIHFRFGDYAEIVDNHVHHCAKHSTEGQHGISVYQPNAFDNKDTIHVYIARNEVHDCDMYVYAWLLQSNYIDDCDYDEGRGITIQQSYYTDGWQLIENNVVYNNGNGFTINGGSNVIVRNNAEYNNQKYTAQHLGEKGRPFVAHIRGAQDVFIYNNIFAMDPDVVYNYNSVIHGTDYSGVGLQMLGCNSCRMENNIVYGATRNWVGGGTIDIGTTNVDPLWVDPDNGDFFLSAGSPAIDVSLIPHTPPIDHFSTVRSALPEVGPIEYDSTRCFSVNIGEDSLNLCDALTHELKTELLTLPGRTFEWYKDGVVIPGETGNSYTATATGIYILKVSGTCEDSDTVVVYSTLLDVQHDTVCAAGNLAELKVLEPGGTYAWYDSAVGGTLVNNTQDYNVNISTSTTYYVEENSALGFYYIGKDTIDDGVLTYYGAPIVDWEAITLDVEKDLKFESVDVFPKGNGNVTLLIRRWVPTRDGEIIHSVTVPGSKEQRLTIDVDYVLQAGGIYMLEVTGNLPLFQDGPYSFMEIPGIVSIDNNRTTGWLSDSYGPFYNYVFRDPDRSCVRTPVYAILDSLHPLCHPTVDCNGDMGGTAYIDSCGVCVEGLTGKLPCTKDCLGMWGGGHSIDSCGNCTGPLIHIVCAQDCNGDWNGGASVDTCGVCSGGLTGVIPNTSCAASCEDPGNASLSSTNPLAQCGGPIVLTAAETGTHSGGGFNYNFMMDIGIGFTSVQDGAANTLNASVSGDYYVVIYDPVDPTACRDTSNTVTVIIDTNPTISDAGINDTICASNYTLKGNTAVIGTGTWTAITGTGIFTNLNAENTNVSGLSIGANTFRWEIINGSCPPSASTVTIVVNDAPTIPNAGLNHSVCGSTTALAGNIIAVGVGTWSTTGSATIKSVNDPNSPVNNLDDGVNTFFWTSSNGTCADVIDTVKIVSAVAPSLANAGLDDTICTENAVLNANVPTGSESGFWTLISGSGNFDNALDPGTTVTGLGIGDNLFEWTLATAPVCPSTFDQVIIRVDERPSSVYAGIDKVLCESFSSLGASAPLVGNGIWNVISGGAGMVINDVLDPTSTITNIPVGFTTLEWKVSNGVCADSSDQIIVERTASAPAVVSLIPSNPAPGCVTLTETFIASPSNEGTGPTYYWYYNGVLQPETGDTLSRTFTDGDSVVVKLKSSSNCASPDSAVSNVAYISTDQMPSTSNAGIDQTICSDSFTLQADVPLVGTGEWSVVSGSASIVDILNPHSEVSGVFTKVIFRWTISNGSCPDSFDDVVLDVAWMAPASVSITAIDTSCIGDTVDFVASGTGFGIGHYEWFVNGISQGTPGSVTKYSYVPDNGDTVTVSLDSKLNCTTPDSVSDDVTITMVSPPLVSISITDSAICENENAILSAFGATGIVNWYKDGTLIAAGNSLLVTTAGNYYFTHDNGLCPLQNSDSITLSVDKLPTVSAGPDVTLNLNQENTATLSGTSSVNSTVWSPSGNLNNPGDLTPVVTVNNLAGDGSMVYTLTATNGECVVSDSMMLTVLKDILIPNAFTPNGDGENDIWKITGLDSKDGFRLTIFNRWGTPVYQCVNSHIPWDGTRNGKLMPVATYYFVIELFDESITYTGSVTLVR